MIHITKSKGGFQVIHLAPNGEVLTNSEILKSKQSCWKNIESDLQNIVAGGERFSRLVQDDVAMKIYKAVVEVKTRKFNKVELTEQLLSAPYIPKSKRKKNGRKD